MIKQLIVFAGFLIGLNILNSAFIPNSDASAIDDSASSMQSTFANEEARAEIQIYRTDSQVEDTLFIHSLAPVSPDTIQKNEIEHSQTIQIEVETVRLHRLLLLQQQLSELIEQKREIIAKIYDLEQRFNGRQANGLPENETEKQMLAAFKAELADIINKIRAVVREIEQANN